MKFNMSLGVDVTNWENVHMERADNRTVYQLNDTEPEFGEGSEYGKAQRREQRRKKMGYMASKYDHDAQPWMLKLDGKTLRQFKGRAVARRGARGARGGWGSAPNPVHEGIWGRSPQRGLGWSPTEVLGAEPPAAFLRRSRPGVWGGAPTAAGSPGPPPGYGPGRVCENLSCFQESNSKSYR